MRILRANQRKSGPERSKKQRILRNRTEGPGPQRHDETLTNSRLDKLGTFIGADLICGRAAASYRRIVVTGFRMTDFSVDRGWA